MNLFLISASSGAGGCFALAVGFGGMLLMRDEMSRIARDRSGQNDDNDPGPARHRSPPRARGMA